MTARYIVADVFDGIAQLEDNSVDLVMTSPPFLALRSYLPADHPNKHLEGGSQPTPGAFIDWLVDVVEALDRVLAPHGSMVIELGDTYSGSGEGGGDLTGSEKYPPGQRSSNGTAWKAKGGGWPADKSLTLIPELFRMTLVYGFNPLTGRQTKRWRLRNVVRWVRPNPPVGALGDKFRPATSELMVFCRTDEAGRRRYFDLDAVRERLPHHDLKPYRTEADSAYKPDLVYSGDDRRTGGVHPAGAPPLDWWNIPLLDGEEETPYGPGEKRKAHWKPGDPNNGPKQEAARSSSLETGRVRFTHQTENPLGAPPLDWWNIPPGGYQGAHYAVFPEALCVRPIKAMCPEKVCRTCGEPSRRIVGEADYINTKNSKPRPDKGGRSLTDEPARYAKGLRHLVDGSDQSVSRVAPTLGFTDCSHPCETCAGKGRFRATQDVGLPTEHIFWWPCPTCHGSGVAADNYRPGLVLDPFAGSGTTLAVAVGHGRDAIGIDLDERNLDLARERIGMFLEAVS